MPPSRVTVWIVAGLSAAGASAQTSAGAPVAGAMCQTATVEGSVNAGQAFGQGIGNGLEVMLQPIHSGWILRVVPAGTKPAATGGAAFLDYAELATPPYQSVTPLSISTDFAFRAQDAVGWNPRRFRFAASRAEYDALRTAYQGYVGSGAKPAAADAAQLARLVAQAPEGVFRIVDARLVPGTADQWRMASAVSSAFPETAHTLVQPGPEGPTPLGRLLGMRFRVELELPAGFRADRGVTLRAHVCGNR